MQAILRTRVYFCTKFSRNELVRGARTALVIYLRGACALLMSWNSRAVTSTQRLLRGEALPGAERHHGAGASPARHPAQGESVIKYKSPLNVLKDTYDYSCCLARAGEYHHLMTDSPGARRHPRRLDAQLAQDFRRNLDTVLGKLSQPLHLTNTLRCQSHNPAQQPRPSGILTVCCASGSGSTVEARQRRQ